MTNLSATKIDWLLFGSSYGLKLQCFLVAKTMNE